MPLLRYGLHARLYLVIDSISIQFKLARFDVYRVVCAVLEGDGRVTEAIECFHQMQRELGDDMNIHNERAQWELSEHYREPCNQTSSEHRKQVFNGDAQRD